MLIDGLRLAEGSAIENITAPSGTSFPTGANVGELFYLTAGDIGLYAYENGAWGKVISSGSSTLTELTDITLTSLTDGELLVSVAGDFINRTIAEAGIEAAFTKNTGFNLIVGTSAGQVASGDHTHSYLSDITGESIKSLSDVFSSMTPTDGQVLTFDTTNGWQSEDAAGGSGSPFTDLEFSLNLSKTTATLNGTATDNHVNLGGGTSVSGVAGQAWDYIFITGEGNSVTNRWSAAVSGRLHTITEQASVIAGGSVNAIKSQFAFVGGGASNVIQSTSSYGVITGGQGNEVATTATHCIIGGGLNNLTSGTYAVIAGGRSNLASGDYSFIGGGGETTGLIQNIASGKASVVVGGQDNTISSLASHSVVVGGGSNKISLTLAGYASIVGGLNNTLNGTGKQVSFIGGGSDNTITATVGGILCGTGNTVTGFGAAVVAGKDNTASGEYSAIAGGRKNLSSGDYSFIGGGGESTGLIQNIASGLASVVVGGSNNSALSTYTFAGGQGSIAKGNGGFAYGILAKIVDGVSTSRAPICMGTSNTVTILGLYGAPIIIGGYNNTNSDTAYSFIAGGQGNSITGRNSFIGSGDRNDVSGVESGIGTGKDNTASGDFSTLGGGRNNLTSGDYSSIGGGRKNLASGDYSFIGGGGETTGLIQNIASGLASVIGGGEGNVASANYTTISGGVNNKTNAIGGTVCGGLGGTAYAVYSTIAGGVYNNITGNTSFIGGGYVNKAIGSYSFVGSGYVNTASGSHSFVGGGRKNLTSGDYSFIGGGGETTGLIQNIASGLASVIGGGSGNEASGDNSVVPGGSNNTASGLNSIVVGGNNNTVTASYGFIGGGTNCIAGAGSYTIVVGGQSCKVLGTGTNNIIVGGFFNECKIGSSKTFIGGGESNKTFGSYSVVAGGRLNNASSNYASVLGGRGNTAIHSHSSASGGGSYTRANFDHVFGATDTLSSSADNNTIRLQGAGGNIKIDGALSTPEADYAEFFEWDDGNALDEDRVGYFVSFIGGKIQKGNTDIIGAISATPAIIGDSADNHWATMYATDDFGRTLIDIYTKHEWVEVINHPSVEISPEVIHPDELDDDGNIIVPGYTEAAVWSTAYDEDVHHTIYEAPDTALFDEYPNPGNITGTISSLVIPGTGVTTESVDISKLNPLFDPSLVYVPRAERKEWDAVGMMGKLLVRSAELITGTHVDVDVNGMAINGTTYRVISVVNANVVRILYV